MTHFRLATACCVLGCAIQANAETLNFTGTFQDYKPVGVGTPLTGVGVPVATWPAYDSDSTAAGVQPLTFSVSGTVDVTGGVVTGAVINQTSVLTNDYVGGSGNTQGQFNGLSWTYTGGTTMSFTPGMAVTGTCTILTGTGSAGCAGALTALQAVDDAGSAWSWQGIPDPFLVSDLFGGANIFNVNVGPHDGVAWSVSGDTITGLVTPSLPNANALLNSGYSATLSLVTVAGPTAEDDGPISVLPSGTVQIDVLANDVGFTDPVTVTLGTLPTKGTALVNGSPGVQAGISISYTANAGEFGADTFTYTIDDGDDSDSATVTVNVTDAGAGDDSAATTRNTPVSINIGANDLGFGNAVTVTINSGSFSAGGSAVVTAGQGGPASGVVATYTPASPPGSPSYVETFTYTIDDGSLPPATAEVTISVSNAVPVAANGTITSISTVGVDPITRTGEFSVLGAGGSLGNDGIVTITVPPVRGTATVNGVDITYRPDSTFFAGDDAFTYTITDTDGETASGEVGIIIASVAPTIPDGRIVTNEGTASPVLNPGVTAGNGALAQHTLVVSSQAVHGACTISPANGLGLVTYTPDAGYFGADSCGLTVTDGAGQSDTSTVSITVNQVINGNLRGGSSALDPWILSLLSALALRRRRRQ